MAKKSSGMTAPSMSSDYQAEDDHRTLTRAEEVRSDKKRFGNARKHGLKQARSVQRLYGRSTGR